MLDYHNSLGFLSERRIRTHTGEYSGLCGLGCRKGSGEVMSAAR